MLHRIGCPFCGHVCLVAPDQLARKLVCRACEYEFLAKDGGEARADLSFTDISDESGRQPFIRRHRKGRDPVTTLDGAFGGAVGGIVAGMVLGGIASVYRHELGDTALFATARFLVGMFTGLLMGFTMGIITGALVGGVLGLWEFHLPPEAQRPALIGGALAGAVTGLVMVDAKWAVVGMVVGGGSGLLWRQFALWMQAHLPIGEPSPRHR